jgi:hypothetical protein
MEWVIPYFTIFIGCGYIKRFLRLLLELVLEALNGLGQENEPPCVRASLAALICLGQEL